MGMGLPGRRRRIPIGKFGSYKGWPYIDGKPIPARDRMLSIRARNRMLSIPPTTTGLCGDSDKFDIQEKEKLSSDIVTTAKPPQSPSRLACSKASLRACSTPMESDQRLDHLKGSDQYQTTRESELDFQEKLSSDIVTTAKPHLPSRLACSKASLRACSTPMESDHIQEKLSSDIVTTVKPRLPSRLSIAKHLRSSSKMRFLHKRKASENKKKKSATM